MKSGLLCKHDVMILKGGTRPRPHPKDTGMLQGPELELGLGLLQNQLAQIKTYRVNLYTV